MRVKDQLERELIVPKIPQRIVSLVPSQTELLVDMGLSDKLVGVTRFCVHPKHIKKEKVVVGGTKQVHMAKIKALRPELIVCNKEENSEEMVLALEQIAPVYVSNVRNPEDAFNMIIALGSLLDVATRAEELCREITDEINIFEAKIKDEPIRKVIYIIWKNPYMSAGKDTFIDAMLGLNRFQNITTANRYPEVTTQHFHSADLILLATEPYPFKEVDVRAVEKSTGIKTLLVDGEYFSWYGSRMKLAFDYFAKLHQSSMEESCED